MQEYPNTGFDPIDREHRAISRSMRGLLAAVNQSKTAEIPTIAALLLGQVAAHFAHEERLMVHIHYPLYERHKKAHDDFLEDARKQLAALRKDGFTPAFRRWTVGRFPNWFRLHIVQNDVGLGLALQKALSPEEIGSEPDATQAAAPA